MVGSFPFFGVDTWDHHNVWLPLIPSSGQSYSWTWQLYCILLPPEDSVSIFIVLDGIHICRERTKTTQDLSPNKDI